MDPNTIAPQNDTYNKVSIDTVRDLWTRTYNTDGKPDWSHIFKFYDDNIIFQDTIQRIEGKEEFIAMCQRLTKRSKQLNMEILTLAQDGNNIIFDWVMTMMFKRYPSTPIYGSTKLTINEEGKITHQRDYYDLWGDIFNNIPVWKKIYRRFLRRRFG